MEGSLQWILRKNAEVDPIVPASAPDQPHYVTHGKTGKETIKRFPTLTPCTWLIMQQFLVI